MALSNNFLHDISWDNFFDTSNVWWFLVTRDGEIVYSSGNCKNFIGVTANEIVKDTNVLLNLIDRNHRIKVRDYFEQRINNRTDVLTISFKVHTPEKTVRWMAAESHPVASSKDNTILFCFCVRDITGSKEEKLHLKRLNKQQNILVTVTQTAANNEPFFSRIDSILKIIGEYTGVSRVYIFEDSNDGMTASNTFEWCNKGITFQKDELQNIPYSLVPSWKKLLSRSGIILNSDIKTLPKDLYDFLSVQKIKSILVLPLYFQDIQYGFIGFDECTRRRIWQKDEINLLKTISNTITNTYYRNKYETELKLTKERLQGLLEIQTKELINKDNYYKALIETQEDLICRWLPDTTLTFVNQSYCKFFNIEESEVLGRRWIELIDSDSRPYIESVIANIFITGKPGIYEHAAKNSNSELRWHQWIDTPLRNQDGIITELQSTGRDVTDRVEYERGITQAKEKIEELDRTKLEFLRLVSHELRTPLNAILGFSELIKSTTHLHDIKTFNSYIYQSGKTLFRMIEDILTLTNLQSGKTTLSLEEVEIISLLKELYEKFENNSFKLENLVSLKLKHYLKRDFRLITDKTKLVFVLTKLLDNAIVFCNKGTIKFGARLNKDNILFYVKDEGIGISKEHQETIFQDFKKIEAKNRSFHEGLGVSLYISRQLIELMGGKIWVNSKINKGSTFYFSLPLQQNIKSKFLLQKIKKDNILPPDLSGRKILIVDDIASNLQYLLEIVKETNASVLWAKNGRECLEIFNTQKNIDCILMDILMPEMDGYEACLQIREFDKKVPIIAQTAYGMDDEVKLLIDSQNFTDCLIKPIWKHELFRMLKMHLLKS